MLRAGRATAIAGRCVKKFCIAVSVRVANGTISPTIRSPIGALQLARGAVSVAGG